MKPLTGSNGSQRWQQTEATLRVESEILALRDAKPVHIIPVEFRREVWSAEVPRRQPKQIGKGKHL
jgi:hypothetical protein